MNITEEGRIMNSDECKEYITGFEIYIYIYIYVCMYIYIIYIKGQRTERKEMAVLGTH